MSRQRQHQSRAGLEQSGPSLSSCQRVTVGMIVDFHEVFDFAALAPFLEHRFGVDSLLRVLLAKLCHRHDSAALFVRHRFCGQHSHRLRREQLVVCAHPIVFNTGGDH